MREGEAVAGFGLGEVKATGLIETITRCANLLRYDGRKKAWIADKCPRELAESYLARGHWGLRPLMGVINAPTLRPDGSLLDRPGYDRATGLLYVPQRGLVFPALPPLADEIDAMVAARAALGTLDELICKFPFACPEARSVALAAFLTGVVRRSLPTAPAFGFTAPVAGTGKGLLSNTIAAVTSGRRPSPITQGNEEETEKRLAGLLMRGDDVICLDNCTEPLGGQKLLSVLTEEIAGLRPLGSSHMVDCQTNSLFLMNGNNLTMLGDMCRRVLVCTIDPGVEHPERRTFAFNPQEMASRDRGRYVAACLTILMAYRAVGMPRQAVPLGSYGEWSRQVRDALLWLGEPDPCLTIDASKANDPIAEKITAVFHHWAEVIGEGARATVKDVIAAAGKASMEGHSGLSDALHDIAAPMVRGSADARVDARRLGDWLKRHKDRIITGRRIVLAELRDGNRQWCLERVGGVR